MQDAALPSSEAERSSGVTTPAGFTLPGAAQVLESHTRPVLSLAVCGNRLFSGSYDYSIRVWNLDTMQVRRAGGGGPSG